jgi:sulfur relay (sulfurtransferase) DsrF/TusC family protein
VAKNVAVVIQEDPRITHRPVEALRIALGLVAGSHNTTVILLGEAVRLLTIDNDDIVDLDILEKYLPSIEQLDIPFILPKVFDLSELSGKFSIRCESEAAVAAVIQSMDCTLVF